MLKEKIILDGKKLSNKILENLKEKCSNFVKKPSLAVVLVGDNDSSHLYVSIKEKACLNIGIEFKKYLFNKAASSKEILSLIKKLNLDPNVDGIIVQLPLPDHIDTKEIINSVDPNKDVDGFNSTNYGNLLISNSIENSDFFAPCTPLGIMKLLKEYKVNLEGKKALVIGRSNVVGKAISIMLMHSNATVTIAHSKTKNLKEIIESSEIIISAVGVPELIRDNMLKNGMVIIDVGITKVNGKVVGDVIRNIKTPVYVSPVPGGVGPMTVAMLLSNVVKAYEKRNFIKISKNS